MKMNLYVVFDKTAEYSMPIWESRNDGTALRTYQKSLIENKDVPEDEMVLMCVGSIDHETNKIIGLDPARQVIPSVSLVDQMEEEDGESI